MLLLYRHFIVFDYIIAQGWVGKQIYEMRMRVSRGIACPGVVAKYVADSCCFQFHYRPKCGLV